MTPEQLRKMRAAKQRAKCRRMDEAHKRVREYRRWLAAGSPTTRVPIIPTDSDYRLLRGAR